MEKIKIKTISTCLFNIKEITFFKNLIMTANQKLLLLKEVKNGIGSDLTYLPTLKVIASIIF